MSDEATAARLARKERRQEAKRRRIVEAAAEELLEHGLDGFKVAGVARRADVSKPAVYYYFRSRDELIAGLLIDRFKAETYALVDAVEAAPDGISALTRVLRAFVAHYRADLASYRVLQIWTLTAGPQTELLKREVYPLSWQVMNGLETKLQADQDAGRLHPDAVPRRLANVAVMLGHGIVSVFAGMDGLGGDLRFPIDGMLDEAVATLARAAQAGDA